VIVEYLFLFPLVKNGGNRPRNARLIVENKVAPFFQDTVYVLKRQIIKLAHTLKLIVF